MAAPGHAAGSLMAEAGIPAGAGCSGTPLARKLGIGAQARVALQGAPAELMQWLGPLPESVRFEALRAQASDVALLFCTQRSVLQPAFGRRPPGPAAGCRAVGLLVQEGVQGDHRHHRGCVHYLASTGRAFTRLPLTVPLFSAFSTASAISRATAT